jgi:hypothetical protein
MKWQQDLVRDIRTGTCYDNQDEPDNGILQSNPWEEVTEANRMAVKEQFLKVRDNCKAILEIGVCRNETNSITHVLLDNKLDDTIYVGIDLEDKTFLNNPKKNIWTIRGNSGSFSEILKIFKYLNVTEFGFIFIDGWHSINQVLIDWEYTSMLSPNGIVGLHDTSYHPGPNLFINALNKDIWDVKENVCPFDNGVGFARRK